MTCKQYTNRDIVYHCESKRIAGYDVCEACDLVEKSNFLLWEELPQEKRAEIMDNVAKKHNEETK